MAGIPLPGSRKGGWGRTRLAEILPVRCLDYEDLVESTEGFSVEVTPAGEEAFSGLDINQIPPLLGYNRTLPRPEGKILLQIKETGDPLLAVMKAGRGQTLAFTSDPARTGDVILFSGINIRNSGSAAWI